ncbi:MAG: EamA family transporter [Fuerstiella sp.]|nr:EamA family transporter [Fuerstiella sp.]
MVPNREDGMQAQPTSGIGILRDGFVLGSIAAVGYSLVNLGLRYLSDSAGSDGSGWEWWVTAMKTMPMGIVAWALVLRRCVMGLDAFPPLRMLPALTGAALLMQFGGNLSFQTALGYLGLGITVPLVFACIICTGASLGRLLLGDPITIEIVKAMSVMLVAIVLLSIGTTFGQSDIAGPSRVSHQNSAGILTGISAAVLSGCSYGAVGVLIRRFVRSELAVESILIVFSTVGGVLLATGAVFLSGWHVIQQATVCEWPILLAAGSANAIAFFAIAHALRVIDVNRLNVINASQNAVCAIGAVALFDEHLSLPAIIGIILTIVGLLALGRQPDTPAT